MKMIVAFVCLVFSFHAFAEDSCGDLTGVFKIDDGAAIRLVQSKCDRLTIAYGEIQQYGKITWYEDAVTSWLNSTYCDAEGCVTSTSKNGVIELTTTKAWINYIPQHGICDFDRDVLTMTIKGYLSRRQTVSNCQDGFEGEVENIYFRIN